MRVIGKSDIHIRRALNEDSTQKVNALLTGLEHPELCTCPQCGEQLGHFSGLEGIPEYEFCPECFDWAYGAREISGIVYLERLFRLE